MTRLIAGLVLLWALGFALFAVAVPGPAGAVRTDAVVVLTGEPGRIGRGLEVLERDLARRLLISGAGRGVRKADLVRAQNVPPRLLDRIDLGGQAVDTRSNADETAEWLRRHRYRSLRLVTSGWHMRRAAFELSRTIGDVKVVEDAVPTEPQLTTLLREYNKYLLRRGGALVGR